MEQEYNRVKGEVFTQIIDESLRLYKLGYVSTQAGNISCRIPGTDLIAITPTSTPYERYHEEGIMCVVGRDGLQIEGKIEMTSETSMHLQILEALPQINAIVHTHSPYATAIAACGGFVPSLGLEGLDWNTPKIYCTEKFVLPGSDLVGKDILHTMEKCPGARGILLRNHGVVAMGQTVEEAGAIAEEIEYSAKQYFIARNMGMGEPHFLTEEEISEANENYKKKKKEAEARRKARGL